MPPERADVLQAPKASRADEGRPTPRRGLSAPLACWAALSSHNVLWSLALPCWELHHVDAWLFEHLSNQLKRCSRRPEGVIASPLRVLYPHDVAFVHANRDHAVHPDVIAGPVALSVQASCHIEKNFFVRPVVLW